MKSDFAICSHISEGLRPMAIALADLTPMVGNAVRHPAKQLKEIESSLRIFGQVEPLVVNRRPVPPVVIGGNGRLVAMLSLGWTHAAVVFVDLSEAEANTLSLALNRTADGREWEKDALDKLLRNVNTHGDERLDAMLSELAEEAGVVRLGESKGAVPDGVDNLLEWDDDDNTEAEFLAPFPWFGGKSRVARAVWKFFGDVNGFIEPFFGSGAMLLNRPLPFNGGETVNDYDGLVANFWRAVQADPDAVEQYADWPVNENDLHARHTWLVERKDSLQAKLEGDPDYFDAKIAGWWVWGMACWIGSGFCSGQGPWRVEEVDGVRQLVHLGGGQGVSRQRVHLGDAGRGVIRQRVHLGDAGQGVSRQRVHLGDAGRGVDDGKPGRGERGLLAWMQALSDRFKRVRVCCGDWTRVCGGDTGDALNHFFVTGQPCAVFLDPPYANTAGRDPSLYNRDSLTVAHAVREWAIRHGDDKRLRIALCGYEGEHQMPDSWRCLGWKAQGGFANQGSVAGGENACRERVWFSPGCLRPDEVASRTRHAS